MVRQPPPHTTSTPKMSRGKTFSEMLFIAGCAHRDSAEDKVSLSIVTFVELVHDVKALQFEKNRNTPASKGYQHSTRNRLNFFSKHPSENSPGEAPGLDVEFLSKVSLKISP